MKNKIINVALIFMLIGVGLYENTAYPQSSLLRPALKFNSLGRLHKIYSKAQREVDRHLDVLKKGYDKGVIPGHLPLPAVNFVLSTDKTSRYEYSRENNTIVFYISKDIKDKDFEKICWLAYGEWFSHNQVAEYNEINHIGGDIWNSPYITYLKERKQIKPDEVQNKIVLDVGTGPGMPGILIAEKGAKQVTCLDVSSFMLEFAQEEANKRGLDNIVFERGSAFKLPFGDNSFDMVFVNLMFEKQPEELRRLAIAEILRVLKPKGKFKLVELYRVAQPVFNIGNYGWSDNEWKNELRHVGFEKIEVLDRTNIYYDYPIPVLRSISYIIEASKPPTSPQLPLLVGQILKRIRSL